MIGLCTDSNAQLPLGLQDRHGIAVVPLTVSIDGVAHLEHVELDADAFYACFDGGRRPEIATAAPSPSHFLAAWKTLTDGGATEILSVHVGAELSGTLNAAHTAAASSSVPVRLVDTGSASFAVGAAAWSAAEAIEGGGSLIEAASAAEAIAARCDNVFVVGTLDLARAGGRLLPGATDAEGLPVLRLVEGKMEALGSARSAHDAAGLMARTIAAAGDGLRVGVGWSDESSIAVADELADLLAAASEVDEVLRYRVGPSVGAHTGPGTAGAVFWSMD